MIDDDEAKRIQENLTVIRNYLLDKFQGFHLVRDQSEGPCGHLFTVADRSIYTLYTLKVSGARLSDKAHTSEDIKRLLDLDIVADRMRDPRNGGYFSW